MKKTEEIWFDIINSLREEIGNHIYENYLKNLKIIESRHNKLFIEVPTQFHREFITKNILPRINAILQQTGENKLEINFIVSKEVSKKNIKTLIKTQSEKTAEKAILEKKAKKYNLNLRFTFDNFVVGSYNHFAYAAALAVSKKPAHSYNPLFIYGGPGLGKTHLLNAIGNKIIELHPDLTVLYVSSEKFTNDMIQSIGNSRMEKFREKYRRIDVLLVDDVHFIGGKTAAQEEFFHTFNTLYNAEKQIVLTSDRPPREIPHLEERLRSRFQSGLMVDIGLPDLETREAILYKKAESKGVDLPPEVAHYIASKIKTNIRDMEGALIRLIAFATHLGKKINLELAQLAVKDMIKETKKKVDIQKIIEVTADFFGIDPKLITSKHRSSHIVLPRQVAMYIARELTSLSTVKIGKSFGSKDHTTVLYAIEKIKNLRQLDPEINEKIERITKELTESVKFM